MSRSINRCANPPSKRALVAYISIDLSLSLYDSINLPIDRDYPSASALP